MNTYELIVGKDCKYSLEKSPYVMGRCKFCSNGTPILKSSVHSF